ncbi:MAG: alpha/beta hydrolase fold protein [Polaromonas sp.]|jgi:pimeloyl-ACP methyl ester carboxylesterase|nr:alpha/beta hydrolase fold protein [Polaromonas sp.]
MELTVKGHKTYCYTGGKAFDAAKPTAVFIHGVLNDHSVWILQTRYFAHHGWNVLAVDLPGHCKSAGLPPATVADAARFIIALLDAAGVAKAALIGHSFGSLIALEVAGNAPDRVSQLVMVGTAYPMKVSPALLEMSRDAPHQAIDLVNVFSHSMLAPPPSSLGPGTWLYGGAKALMRRVLASNPAGQLFHTGFKACDGYAGGDAAMRAVSCEVLFILGRHDQMTPPKSAQGLVKLAVRGRVALLDAGHSVMTEAPEQTLSAMKDFLRP